MTIDDERREIYRRLEVTRDALRKLDEDQLSMMAEVAARRFRLTTELLRLAAERDRLSSTDG